MRYGTRRVAIGQYRPSTERRAIHHDLQPLYVGNGWLIGRSYTRCSRPWLSVAINGSGNSNQLTASQKPT